LKVQFGTALHLLQSAIFTKRYKTLAGSRVSCRKKITCAVGQISGFPSSILLHQRGVCAIVTTRRTRDAMDAGGFTRRVMLPRGRRNRVVLTPRRWGQARGQVHERRWL